MEWHSINQWIELPIVHAHTAFAHRGTNNKLKTMNVSDGENSEIVLCVKMIERKNNIFKFKFK